MTDSTVLVIGHYEIAIDDVEDFRTTIIETAKAARQIDGCVHYSFAADLENPGLFHLAEIWREQGAFEERLASDAFRETGRKVSRMTVLGRSVVRYNGAIPTPL